MNMYIYIYIYIYIYTYIFIHKYHIHTYCSVLKYLKSLPCQTSFIRFGLQHTTGSQGPVVARFGTLDPRQRLKSSRHVGWTWRDVR